MKFWNSVKDEMIYETYSVEDLIKDNCAYFTSYPSNMLRGVFWKDLSHKGTLKTLKKYSVNSLYGKMCIKAYIVMKKIKKLK